MASAGTEKVYRFTRTLLLVLFTVCGIGWSIQRSMKACDYLDLDIKNIRFSDIVSSSLNSSLGQLSALFTSSQFEKKRQIFNLRKSTIINLDSVTGRHAWLTALLLLSGDLHQNPGPKTMQAPCGVCHKECTWKQRAVACDSCNTWFHTGCMAMNTHIYHALANSSISWYCCTCGLPNFSSSLFLNSPRSSSTFFTSFDFNPFDVLAEHRTDYNFTTSPSKPIPPMMTSTPNGKDKGNKNEHLKNKLKCLIINFQSITNKREELSNIVDDSKVDVIIGSETWLEPSVGNSELLLDDYDIYRRDRVGQKGGGVLIGIRKCFTSESIHVGKTSENIFCRINRKGKRPLIIGSIYRPPNSDLDACNSVCEEIFDLVRKNKKAVFLFGGDFNLPDIEWESEEIVGNQYPKLLNTKFLEMTQDLGFKQIVKEPSRGNAFLDLFFTNNPGLIENSTLVPGLGDHDAFEIETSLQPFRKKPIKRKIQLWNKIDEIKLQKDAHDYKMSFLEQFTVKDDVNKIWKHVKENLETIMDRNVPTKFTSTRFHQPWINTESKRLLRRKKKWFKKAKSCNSQRVWDKYKKIKSECQRVCRKTHQNFVNNMINEDDSANKKLWSYIKSKKQENVGISDLRNSKDTLIQDPTGKANLLNSQFSSVFSTPDPPISNDFEEKDKLPDIHSINITSSGVLKLLLNIKSNKATGPDGIPGKILKLCAYELVDVYQLLFQASLDQGIVPSDWKGANIVPLFKKGDKSKAENYRPVSLTSISCKLLEHVVHSNIMDHLDKFKILNDAQHGFRQKRSCETQLITTINDFSNCLNEKGQIDAILLDFSKAFDKVDHEGLILKLEHLGIRNSLIKWIRSFLIGREQKVLVEGMESDSKPVLSGVPQGTVLGPLFFLVYINDISNGISPGTSIRLFADDSLLYRTIRTPEDAKILQQDLNKLQEWENKWKMEFHPGKCQLLRISNKRKIIPSDYSIHNVLLSHTDSAKYLGVVIDSKLRWKQQYTNICKKANGVLALLRRNLNSCPPQVKSKCYSTLVRPILEYGCAVWDPYHQIDKNKIEQVQKSAARFITNNYCMETGNTKRNMIHLGWEPLEERRAKNKVTTFYKAKNRLIEIPIEHLIVNKNKTRNGGQTYALPSSTVNSHLHSYYPSAVRLWNPLPAEAKNSESLASFRGKLEKITVKTTF